MTEHEDKQKPLSKEEMKAGLSQLARTADGLSLAYVRLEVKGKGITSLDVLENYPHLRHLDLSDNQIESLKPLKSLEYLVTVTFDRNAIQRLELKTCNLCFFSLFVQRFILFHFLLI
jgi:hypothetical protein